MSDLSILLLIIFLGYLLGRIKIKGIQLGTSGILLVALIFGHLGYTQPKILGDLGLVLFVGSVGYISGPVFIKDIKSNGLNFLIIGASVITTGFLILYLLISKFSLPAPLALGLLSGALTSTPALAAGLEATGGSQLVAVGYGIAYVFGVVGVILFVQIMPKISKTGVEIENINNATNLNVEDHSYKDMFQIDKYNLAMFSLAIFLGIILGSIKIPLGNVLNFSLGTSGGPLLMGILFGSKRSVGKILFHVDEGFLCNIREIGLILFLIRSGLASGDGFIAVLREYGYMLFIYGALITIIPMLLGYFVSRFIFKTNLQRTLGSITGAMTSTPALGTLMEVFDNDVSVGAAYAGTYPMALVLLVLLPQFLVMLI